MKYFQVLLFFSIFLFFSCSMTSQPLSNSNRYDAERKNYTLTVVSGGCSTSICNLNYLIDSDETTYTQYQILGCQDAAFQHILLKFPKQTVSKIFIKSTDSANLDNSQAEIFVNVYDPLQQKEVRASTIYADKYLSFPNGKEYSINMDSDQIEIYFSNNNADEGIRNINIYEITVYDLASNII